MYIYVAQHRHGQIRNAPSLSAKIIANIPHGTFVQVSYFNYIWRKITWKNICGFIPANSLSVQDPSDILWQMRYGYRNDSTLLCTSTPAQLIQMKADLFACLSPCYQQLKSLACYDQATSDAVYLFQITHHLFPDGIAGPETKAALISEFKNRYH